MMAESTGVEERKAAAPLTGSVHWFDVTRGYGFIERDDNKEDVFVHWSAIGTGESNSKERKSLDSGELVAFSVVEDEKGRQKAVGVTGPEGRSVRGSRHGRGALQNPYFYSDYYYYGRGYGDIYGTRYGHQWSRGVDGEKGGRGRFPSSYYYDDRLQKAMGEMRLGRGRRGGVRRNTRSANGRHKGGFVENKADRHHNQGRLNTLQNESAPKGLGEEEEQMRTRSKSLEHDVPSQRGRRVHRPCAFSQKMSEERTTSAEKPTELSGPVGLPDAAAEAVQEKNGGEDDGKNSRESEKESPSGAAKSEQKEGSVEEEEDEEFDGVTAPSSPVADEQGAEDEEKMVANKDDDQD